MTASILCFNRVTGDFGLASLRSAIEEPIAFHAGWNGVILSQADAHPHYIYGGIEALNNGSKPLNALHHMVAQDTGAPGRQVALIDSFGRIAVYSGHRCIASSFNTSRDSRWSICTMATNSHQDMATEMLAAFQKKGSRTEGCLLAGLFTAHEVGQRKTASITVISGATGERTVDLIVHDDHEALFKLCLMLLTPSMAENPETLRNAAAAHS